MLSKALKPKRLTTIADVGASPIDGPTPYARMLAAAKCQVFGFEPNLEALKELNSNRTVMERYLPNVIGDGNDATLHICAAPGMSGLLMPDEERLKCFNGFTAWGQVLHTESVKTDRLDDVFPQDEFDFLKIDVQGGEIQVFDGAPRLLGTAVAVQTEVSFFPLYHQQPTFGDIDTELRDYGYLPHRFVNVKRWMVAPLQNKATVHAALNQLLEADIVYIRDIGKMHEMTSEQLKHLALLAHYVFDSSDIVVRCLRELTRRSVIGDEVIGEYLGTINT